MLVDKIMMLGLARCFACLSRARSACEKTCSLHPCKIYMSFKGIDHMNINITILTKIELLSACLDNKLNIAILVVDKHCYHLTLI